MAVRRSFNALNQVRVSVPDFRGIESAVRADFDELLSGLITGASKPLVIRGFELDPSGINQSAESLVMTVADSAILHGTSTTAGTFLTIPSSETAQVLNSNTNAKVQGSFTPNSLNYIGIEYARQADSSTSIQRYFWSPATKSEFIKTAPQSELLDYRIIISPSSFAVNVLPIAVVQTDAGGGVESIEDRRPMLFRLGTAGTATPNPQYEYPWTNHVEGRAENPYISTSSTVSPFHGGDKQIKTMKEMFDALMTEIKLIKGQPYWYSPSTGGSIYKLRNDVANTLITSKGSVVHNQTIPGRINWTRAISLLVVGSRLEYVIAENPSSTDIVLADNQVAYLKLQRDIEIVPELIYVNGSASVVSVANVTWTTDLLAGDYIKLSSEDDNKYYKIQSVTNGYTVVLTNAFLEPSQTGKSVYSFGTYETNAAPSTLRHVWVNNRLDVPANQDNFWLYLRQDAGSVSYGQNKITALADVAGSLHGKSFKLYSNDNIRQYRMIFDNGSAPLTPVLSDREILVKIPLINNSTDAYIASTLADVIGDQEDFTTLAVGNEVTITNSLHGIVDPAVDVDTAFTFLQIAEGAKAKVYARFFGSELEQGETRQISDNDNLELLSYVGSKSEADAFPKYSSAVERVSEQTFTVTFPDANTLSSSESFRVYTTQNAKVYRFWMSKDGGGSNPAGISEIPQQVSVITGDTAAQVAAKFALVLATLTEFSFTDNLDGTITVSQTIGGNASTPENVDVAGLSITLNAIGSGAQNYFIQDDENLTKSIKKLDIAIKNVLDSVAESNYEEEYSIIAGSPSNIYELTGPILTGTTLTMPVDSANGALRSYLVGEQQLEIFLNGVYLRQGLGNDWLEVGTAGDESVQIQLLIDLEIRDKIQFRIDSSAGGSLGGMSGSGEANTASNVGATGHGVFKTKAGVDLQFKKLVAGAGVTITTSSDNLTITSATTAVSNKNVTTVVADYAILTSDDYVRALNSGSNLTLTLPPASNTGKEIIIKKIDAGNTLFIATTSNETIDGIDATLVPVMITAQYESVSLIANGSNWEIT